MTVIQEVEMIIPQLPAHKAFMLRCWLNEFENAHRYKKLKTYAIATKTLTAFKRSNGDASLN